MHRNSPHWRDASAGGRGRHCGHRPLTSCVQSWHENGLHLATYSLITLMQ